MKIVFVDFDGPLIPGRAFVLNRNSSVWNVPCKTSGSLINELLQRADAKFVISSTWRRIDGLSKCIKLLKEAGVDITRMHEDWFTTYISEPGHTRSAEILEWTSRHNPEAFIAIDDMELIGLPDRNKVHCSTEDGFLMTHYLESCDKLGVDPF